MTACTGVYGRQSARLLPHSPRQRAFKRPRVDLLGQSGELYAQSSQWYGDARRIRWVQSNRTDGFQSSEGQTPVYRHLLAPGACGNGRGRCSLSYSRHSAGEKLLTLTRQANSNRWPAERTTYSTGTSMPTTGPIQQARRTPPRPSTRPYQAGTSLQQVVQRRGAARSAATRSRRAPLSTFRPAGTRFVHPSSNTTTRNSSVIPTTHRRFTAATLSPGSH